VSRHAVPSVGPSHERRDEEGSRLVAWAGAHHPGTWACLLVALAILMLTSVGRVVEGDQANALVILVAGGLWAAAGVFGWVAVLGSGLNLAVKVVSALMLGVAWLGGLAVLLAGLLLSGSDLDCIKSGPCS